MKVLDDKIRKDFIFDLYSKINSNFKEYDKITRRKMLDFINDFYSDYYNIIDICTVRELKFLKRLSSGEKINHSDEKYDFEITALISKMLIGYDFNDGYLLADEFKDNIMLALSKVDMKKAKKVDELNEFLVGFCKVNGNVLVETLINLASQLFNYSDEELREHIINNKLFRYYVMFNFKYIESLDNEMVEALYSDYYYVMDKLDENRKKYDFITAPSFDLEMYKNIFYNNFDTDNKIVSKFLKEIKALPFFWDRTLEEVRICALLNEEREELKESISNVPVLKMKHIDLTNLFELMDKAMDEMPSGALNGMCPREYKEKLKEKAEYEFKREMEYTGQGNACLGDDVAKNFYNLYFSLLEYVNNKYHIDTSLKKIYKQEYLDPNRLMPIIEYLFEDKEKIIDAYIKDNPHNFNSEDLEKVSKFKQGIRGMFTIAKYEEDYTAILASDRVYMIKGLNSNIDEVIPYHNIPCIVTTSLFPYDGVIIYDGLLSTYPISMGTSFAKIVEKEYNEDMKYYHL